MDNNIRYKKINDYPGFVKDSHTGGILNTDNHSLSAYKIKKKAMQDKENRLASIESEMAEVKSMLEQILRKLT